MYNFSILWNVKSLKNKMLCGACTFWHEAVFVNFVNHFFAWKLNLIKLLLLTFFHYFSIPFTSLTFCHRKYPFHSDKLSQIDIVHLSIEMSYRAFVRQKKIGCKSSGENEIDGLKLAINHFRVMGLLIGRCRNMHWLK